MGVHERKLYVVGEVDVGVDERKLYVVGEVVRVGVDERKLYVVGEVVVGREDGVDAGVVRVGVVRVADND